MAISYTYSPRTWTSLDLDDKKQQDVFLQQVSTSVFELQNSLNTASVISSILNGSKLLSSALSFVQVSSTPTINQTVNTNQSSIVWVSYSWSTAANFTVTFNNVVDGQIVLLTIGNTSGAARTFTVLANTITPTAMSVITGSSVLSSGVSINNNVRVMFLGVASATNLQIFGVGQNW
jgi:hypothetical protein